MHTSVACRHSADVKKEKEDILKRLNAKVKLALLHFYIMLLFVTVCFYSVMLLQRDIHAIIIWSFYPFPFLLSQS